MSDLIPNIPEDPEDVLDNVPSDKLPVVEVPKEGKAEGGNIEEIQAPQSHTIEEPVAEPPAPPKPKFDMAMLGPAISAFAMGLGQGIAQRGIGGGNDRMDAIKDELFIRTLMRGLANTGNADLGRGLVKEDVEGAEKPW